MTPPDHFLTGLSIGAVYSSVCGIFSLKRIPYFIAFTLCALFAILPDIDAFRGVYSSPDPFIGHRGITHSLLFVTLVSIISILPYLAGRAITRYYKSEKTYEEKKLLWIDLFLLLLFAGVSHLILDIPQPPGIWGGIPLFFPLKINGQFARIGGWNKIGWYDYRITWILFITVSVSIVTLILMIFLKKNIFIKKILYMSVLIISAISYILITSTIANSSYKNSKEWNESQSKYIDTLPECFRKAAVHGRTYILRIIK
ncbi:MAG: metal-dependent hydrolase [Spirochaetes bacterium]|nr:metal-dependent hydrolase [Spirochaetota bacterium]